MCFLKNMRINRFTKSGACKHKRSKCKYYLAFYYRLEWVICKVVSKFRRLSVENHFFWPLGNTSETTKFFFLSNGWLSEILILISSPLYVILIYQLHCYIEISAANWKTEETSKIIHSFPKSLSVDKIQPAIKKLIWRKGADAVEIGNEYLPTWRAVEKWVPVVCI